MIRVDFIPTREMETRNPGFVVVGARYRDRWIYVRHRKRRTWEAPGGHIEAGESPLQAAARELYEETGAAVFTIRPVCGYVVIRPGNPDSYGMLYVALIDELGDLPDFEIAEIQLSGGLPAELTYPEIQPHLYKEMCEHLFVV